MEPYAASPNHWTSQANRQTYPQLHLIEGSAKWLFYIRCGNVPDFDMVHMHEHPLAEMLFVAVMSLLHSTVVAERH